MVTTDEIPDPYKLELTTWLNGQVMQNASIDLIMFRLEELISYISTFIALEPGDVIVSGTPGGVGHGRKPPLYLKDGDVVEVDVTGIGRLRNPVVKERAEPEAALAVAGPSGPFHLASWTSRTYWWQRTQVMVNST